MADQFDVFGDDDDIDLLGLDSTNGEAIDNIDITKGLDDLELDALIGFQSDRNTNSPKKRQWDDIDVDEQKDFLSWLDEETGKLSPKRPGSPKKINNQLPSEVSPPKTAPPLTTNWDVSEDGFFQQLQNELAKGDQVSVHDDIRAMCIQNGYIPHGLRLAVWGRLFKVHHQRQNSLLAGIESVANDLPSQNLLRQELEKDCGKIFRHPEAPKDLAAECNSTHDARILFLEKAEKLFTFFCKRRSIDYPSGLCRTFLPLLLLGAEDILAEDLFNTLYAICTAVLPHLSFSLSIGVVASARRSLVKKMLFYHEPGLALYLDQKLPDWIAAPSNGTEATQSSGIIYDTSLAALFDHMLDDLSYRLILWDRCLLQNPVSPSYLIFVALAQVIAVKEKIMGCPDQILDPTKVRSDMNKAMALPSSVCDIADVADRLVQATPLSVIELCTQLMDAADESSRRESRTTNGSENPREIHEQRTRSGSKPCPVPSYFTLTVKAAEVVPSIIKGRKNSPEDQIRYFVVDCRSTESVKKGRLPTAFHFNPESLTDPKFVELVMNTLGPLRGSVHICLMGDGVDHATSLIDDGPSSEDLDAIAQETAQMNDMALFLSKRGFPYVNVVEGGYSAAHFYLAKSTTFGLSDLADHAYCSYCERDGVDIDDLETKSDTSVDSSTNSYMTSFAGALKDGKSWLKKKKDVAEGRMGDPIISETLKGGKNWLLKKTEDLDFSDVKIPFPSGRSVTGISSEDSSESSTKKATALASSLGTKFSSLGMKIRTVPTEEKSLEGTAKESSALDNAKRLSSKFKTTISSLRKDSSVSKPAKNPAIVSPPHNTVDSLFTIDHDENEGDDSSDDDTEVITDFDSAMLSAISLGSRVYTDQARSYLNGPFFFSHKKEKRKHRTVMLPRYLGIIAGYLVVLKTDPNNDDVSIVKHCHHLSRLSRMTCFKKNTQLIALYYDDELSPGEKTPHTYQLQERDDFISHVKLCMEQLVE